MRLIEQTEKYVVESEEEAVRIINSFKEAAVSEHYVLGAGGYTYKTKKAKGGEVWECWIVTIKKVLGGVWDDYE